MLGSGAFGLVMKAKVHELEVAVKTVKAGAEKSYLKALLSELKILMYLGGHENLIGLIGANTANLEKGSSFYLINAFDIENNC